MQLYHGVPLGSKQYEILSPHAKLFSLVCLRHFGSRKAKKMKRASMPLRSLLSVKRPRKLFHGSSTAGWCARWTYRPQPLQIRTLCVCWCERNRCEVRNAQRNWWRMMQRILHVVENFKEHLAANGNLSGGWLRQGRTLVLSRQAPCFIASNAETTNSHKGGIICRSLSVLRCYP